MSLALLVPLSALAMWLAALYIEHKFRVKRPEPEAAKATAAIWKRVVIVHYTAVRATGLLLFWMGSLGLAVLNGDGSSLLVVIPSLLIVVGLALYLVAISWDLLLSPRR